MNEGDPVMPCDFCGAFCTTWELNEFGPDDICDNCLVDILEDEIDEEFELYDEDDDIDDTELDLIMQSLAEEPVNWIKEGF